MLYSLLTLLAVKRPDHLRFLTLRRLVLQRPMQRHHTLSELHALIDKLGSTPSHNTAVLRVLVLGSHPVAVRHLSQAWHVDATVNAAGLTAQVGTQVYSFVIYLFVFQGQTALLCLNFVLITVTCCCLYCSHTALFELTHVGSVPQKVRIENLQLTFAPRALTRTASAPREHVAQLGRPHGQQLEYTTA